MTDEPELRVSDQDRDQVVAALNDHAASGRLTLAEHEERVERALVAKTRSDLEPLTRDLPSVAPTPAARRKPTRWLISFMGGSDRKGRWRVGERLTTVSVMGGGTLDLRGAEIDGGEVTIVAVSVMGGHDIYLPDSVDVEVSGLAIMGETTSAEAADGPGPERRWYACARTHSWVAPPSGGCRRKPGTCRCATRAVPRKHSRGSDNPTGAVPLTAPLAVGNAHANVRLNGVDVS